MNIRKLRKIDNIENNLNKLLLNKWYLCGDYFSVREKYFATVVARVSKTKFIFKHLRKRYEDVYE